ncbi:MAG: hypothetical protein DMF94_34825 [Acidobacteria bacterium]|nr:MAG: hypothetical protein DMF94_34825 [Acidobacteriota bacterium]
MPVNGRQMSQLMLQAPGAQNAGTGTWQDVRFSGRANEQNVIKYDGVEGSAIIDASPGNVNGETNTPFKLQASLENVQEFRVESSSYPAEYGTGTGGQVSVITKSGANKVHGAIFEYLRNQRFDAPNYFDSTRNVDGSVIASLERAEPVQQRCLGIEAHQTAVLRRLRAGRMACAAQLHAELRSSVRLLHAAPRGRQPDCQIQHRNAAAALRGNRLQDQRRPRQLQLPAALSEPSVGSRPVDERAVRDRVQQRQYGRVQRSPI